MTTEDIILSAQVQSERDKELAKTLAWIVYNGAALTGISINDPKKFPKLEDAFPSLFEKKEEDHLQVMQTRMEAFAARHNRKFTDEE